VCVCVCVCKEVTYLTGIKIQGDGRKFLERFESYSGS